MNNTFLNRFLSERKRYGRLQLYLRFWFAVKFLSMVWLQQNRPMLSSGCEFSSPPTGSDVVSLNEELINLVVSGLSLGVH